MPRKTLILLALCTVVAGLVGPGANVMAQTRPSPRDEGVKKGEGKKKRKCRRRR